MAAAVLLTALALAGVLLGSLLGQPRTVSSYLTAAGGGLLSGISLFWLLPEIASASNWTAALVLTGVVAIVIAYADHTFLAAGKAPGTIALTPVLSATAIHSFLDGWSVRALESIHIASVTGPLALALHKIPEGLAVGWIARQALASPLRAALLGTLVELVTLLGAWCEPAASRSAFAAFGSWWTSALLALIAGSFLFFGAHAAIPNVRRIGVMCVFASTFLLVAAIGLWQGS